MAAKYGVLFWWYDEVKGRGDPHRVLEDVEWNPYTYAYDPVYGYAYYPYYYYRYTPAYGYYGYYNYNYYYPYDPPPNPDGAGWNAVAFASWSRPLVDEAYRGSFGSGPWENAFGYGIPYGSVAEVFCTDDCAWLVDGSDPLAGGWFLHPAAQFESEFFRETLNKETVLRLKSAVPVAFEDGVFSGPVVGSAQLPNWSTIDAAWDPDREQRQYW